MNNKEKREKKDEERRSPCTSRSKLPSFLSFLRTICTLLLFAPFLYQVYVFPNNNNNFLFFFFWERKFTVRDVSFPRGSQFNFRTFVSEVIWRFFLGRAKAVTRGAGGDKELRDMSASA